MDFLVLCGFLWNKPIKMKRPRNSMTSLPWSLLARIVFTGKACLSQFQAPEAIG